MTSKRIGLVVAIALVAVAFGGLANAQQQPPPLSVKELNGGVYWTQGGAGGNTGIIVGKDGVIVIDAKTTPASAKDMLAEIAKITPKPVTTVILTHSDGDHVNGIVAFPKDVKVITHENNKKEQQAAIAAGGRGAPPADRQNGLCVLRQCAGLDPVRPREGKRCLEGYLRRGG